MTQEQVQAAWEAGTGSGKSAIGESVYVGHALHQELENAVNDGEKEVVANLSSKFLLSMFRVAETGVCDVVRKLIPSLSSLAVMVLATLTSELSQWIFTKVRSLVSFA